MSFHRNVPQTSGHDWATQMSSNPSVGTNTDAVFPREGAAKQALPTPASISNVINGKPFQDRWDSKPVITRPSPRKLNELYNSTNDDVAHLNAPLVSDEVDLAQRLRLWNMAAVGYPIQVMGQVTSVILTLLLVQFFLFGVTLDRLFLRLVLYTSGLVALTVHLILWLVLSSGGNIDMSNSLPTPQDVLSANGHDGSQRESYFHRITFSKFKHHSIINAVAKMKRWHVTQMTNQPSATRRVFNYRQLLLLLMVLYTNVMAILFFHNAITLMQPSITIIMSSIIFASLELIVLAVGQNETSPKEHAMWMLHMIDPLTCPLWNILETLSKTTIGPLQPSPANLLKYARDDQILYLCDWRSTQSGFFSTVPWLSSCAVNEAVRLRLDRCFLELVPFCMMSLNASLRAFSIAMLATNLVSKISIFKVVICAISLLLLAPHAIVNYLFGLEWELNGDLLLPISLLSNTSEQIKFDFKRDMFVKTLRTQQGGGNVITWLIVATLITLVTRLLLREYRQLTVLSDKTDEIDGGSVEHTLSNSTLWCAKAAALSKLCASFGVKGQAVEPALFAGFLVGSGRPPVNFESNDSYLSSIWTSDTRKILDGRQHLVLGGCASSSLVDTDLNGIQNRDQLYSNWTNLSMYTPTYVRPRYVPSFLWSMVVVMFKSLEAGLAMCQVIVTVPFNTCLYLFNIVDQFHSTSQPTSISSENATTAKLMHRSTQEALSVALCGAFPESSYEALLSINGFPIMTAIKGAQAGFITKGTSLIPDAEELAAQANDGGNLSAKLLRMSATGALPHPAVVTLGGVSIVNPSIPVLLLSPYRLALPLKTVLSYSTSPSDQESYLLRMGSTLASRKYVPLDGIWNAVEPRLIELNGAMTLIASLLNNPIVMYQPPALSMPSNRMSSMLNGPRQLRMGELVYRMNQALLNELYEIGSSYTVGTGLNPFDLFFYGAHSTRPHPSPLLLQYWSFRMDNDALLLTQEEYQGLIDIFTKLLSPVMTLSRLAVSAVFNLIEIAMELEGHTNQVGGAVGGDVWMHELQMRGIPQKMQLHMSKLEKSVTTILQSQEFPLNAKVTQKFMNLTLLMQY